jgi:hypothetical protein
MFEYIVLIEFTADSKDEDFKLEGLEVAKFNFDLGLQISEEIQLTDISIFGEEKTSYTGVVKKKEKSIKQQKNGDVFSVYIFVEVADKDNFEKIRDLLKQHRPDKF